MQVTRHALILLGPHAVLHTTTNYVIWVDQYAQPGQLGALQIRRARTPAPKVVPISKDLASICEAAGELIRKYAVGVHQRTLPPGIKRGA